MEEGEQYRDSMAGFRDTGVARITDEAGDSWLVTLMGREVVDSREEDAKEETEGDRGGLWGGVAGAPAPAVPSAGSAARAMSPSRAPGSVSDGGAPLPRIHCATRRGESGAARPGALTFSPPSVGVTTRRLYLPRLLLLLTLVVLSLVGVGVALLVCVFVCVCGVVSVLVLVVVRWRGAGGATRRVDRDDRVDREGR